ncbi:hypothetical protein G4G28_13520 [Massilia sp. Dwa41.01b]|uniref:hypothetical protein n=1 Tax=Massilia sp. Dwa41.01b TaxID=2709302 RepID=UPI0015FF2F2A|nr:hypothetical protein [Massilia sp. Dwa41.01b]QNA89231.1 hypothetical protein G4G28_13520 [Massilia sp. Dwa41.01b]
MPGHADSSATGLALSAAAPLDTLFPQRLEGEELLGGLFGWRWNAAAPTPPSCWPTRWASMSA